MERNSKLAKLALLGAGALGLAGCFSEGPARDVEREELNDLLGSLETYYTAREGKNIVGAVGAGRKLYISDEDGDGNADSIHYAGMAYWVAPNFETEFYADDITRVMTPEIREAATRVLQSQRDLSYFILKDDFLAEQNQE